MSKSILVLNGPNLNLLGTRQPDIYGSKTLVDLQAECVEKGEALGYRIDFRQSNSEGTLVDWIHEARNRYAGVVLNAGAYTHTSIALMDAIASVGVPVVEVHISNIHQREDFRNVSYISKTAMGMICGFGIYGYSMALDALVNHLRHQSRK